MDWTIFNSNNKSKENSKKIINHRFSLTLPEEWIDGTVYTFMGPQIDGIRHDIQVTIREMDLDIDACCQQQIDDIAATLDKFKLMQRNSFTLDNGCEGREIVFQWQLSEEKPLIQRLVLVRLGPYLYTLTSSYSTDSWPAMSDQVAQIIKSFTVIELDHSKGKH